MTSGEPSRATGIARALTLSWFAGALAGAAHLAAGGTPPGLTASLVVGAFLTIAGMPLCRSAFRLTRHGPMLLVQQFVTHAALSQMSSNHSAPVRPTAQLAAALDNGHAVHASVAHLQHAASTSSVMASGHMLMPSPMMIVAHLCSAVLVAALLTQAESGWVGLRALQRGQEWAAQRLVVLLARLSIPVLTALNPPLPVLRGHDESGSAPPPALADLWRSPAPCRRGPPRPCAA
ncbi:hypothetical protein ACOCJ7_05500 [Knoellia sp. CPCC 206453]|uniref:hypothetical protein n=1 Tax=Knoellia pratensis TaxID=3404796 RepID=UPI00361A47BD